MRQHRDLGPEVKEMPDGQEKCQINWPQEYHHPITPKIPHLLYSKVPHPHYPKSQLCPKLIKIAKQSQTPSQFRGPFLCAASPVLEHKLNKICLEIFLRFTLNFCLGKPKNSSVVNNCFILSLPLLLFFLFSNAIFLIRTTYSPCKENLHNP